MATDKATKMRERMVAQAFGLIELTANEAKRKPEKRASAIVTIERQLKVLAEIGEGEEQLSL